MRGTFSFGRCALILLLAASLGACSRYIEGDVFLDKNANNVKDHDEPAIAGMPYTVTRNGAALQASVTDSDGHFFVATGINDIDVNFCARVRSEDVSAFRAPDPETGKALKALEASPEPTAEACSKKSDGKPNCEDPDCCEASECQGDSACEEEEEEEDEAACPKDSRGDPDCGDSRCSSEAACNTYQVQALQACDTAKAAQLTLRLDVPVAVDYATRVGKLDTVRTGPIAAGEKFGIEITYPSSCRFEPFVLSKAFVPSGLGKAYDDATRELRLGEAILEQPSQVIRRDAPPFGHDKLHTYVLRLEATGRDGPTDGELKIQPTLTCPDGKRISATANVLVFGDSSAGAEETFSLTSGLASGCPALGELATFKTLVEARDSAAYAGATYTVFLGGEEHLAIDSMPSQCRDKGATIECDMDTLHLGMKSEFSIKFRMAQSLPGPATLSFTSQLEADGTQVTAPAVACSYP